MKKSSLSHARLNMETAMELGEPGYDKLEPIRDAEQQQETIKFHPKPPPPRDKFASPMGKMHTRTPKLVPIKQKENYEGEENMLNVFDAVRRQPAGFFLYLTHTYAKTSVNYNFYNVRVVNYVNCNKDEYFTLTSMGCVTFVLAKKLNIRHSIVSSKSTNTI